MGVVATLGSAAYKLLYNGLTIVVTIALVAAIYGLYYAYKRWKVKKNSFKKPAGVSVLVVKRDGSWFTDTLGYYRHPDKIDKLTFKNIGHTIPMLPSNCVRGGQAILFNYAPKQYCAVPCNLWERIDLKKFNIEVVNMQMKNFVFLEQRAAVSRWAYVKDLMMKLAPWITIVLVGAVAVTMVWFIAKFGMDVWGQIIAARTTECSQLIPNLQANIPVIGT